MHEHGTKPTSVYLPADGEASWSLLPSLVSALSGGTVLPENTYSCILKVKVSFFLVFPCFLLSVGFDIQVNFNMNHS